MEAGSKGPEAVQREENMHHEEHFNSDTNTEVGESPRLK